MNKDNSISSIPPVVSVIIPIYNTEIFLRDALDSICNQTLQELEIILINDGSTDGCQSIIEEYALKDIRIQWYMQYNQGQAVARNNGLLFAKGKYIYFMDSDDILDTNALQQCYQVCEQNELDSSIFDAEAFIDNCKVPDTYNYNRKGIINEDRLWNGLELLNYELEHYIFFASPCLFFTKRAFLKNKFEGFPSGIIHEDHAFAMQIMLNAQRIRYIAQPYFKRRVRANSTMTATFGMRNIEGYTTVCTRIRSWAQFHEEYSSINNYLTQTLNAVIWEGHKMTLLEKIETLCRFRRLKLSKYITFRSWMVFWFYTFYRPVVHFRNQGAYFRKNQKMA